MDAHKRKTSQEITTADTIIHVLIEGELTKQDITLEQFSREVKINSGTLGHFMRQDRNLSIPSLILLADYFGVSIDAIMGRRAGRA